MSLKLPLVLKNDFKQYSISATSTLRIIVLAFLKSFFFFGGGG